MGIGGAGRGITALRSCRLGVATLGCGLGRGAVALLRGVLTVRAFAKELDVVHDNFCGVTVCAGLVCPLAGTEAALNKALAAFVNEFLCKVCGVPPCYDAVPFRVFLPVAATVCVAFCRCKTECGDFGVGTAALGIVLKVTYFGVISNVTDQHYFVQ